ncbi:MAG: replication-associated recombination protein A [Bacteroides sp.]|nr:replication-associated recombination protein A [Bacillota bacterium]MCM1394038.1 replication-associated recombination protein A [[Eubacterium] siraeum]MCM1455878.1 replication-associated recombination protein A [Bacteroides sp.]
MDIFDLQNNVERLAPLAERMRPRTLQEFLGQGKIVGEGSLLRRAISADRLGSCIFYGPPGTGKTTLANIIAESTNANFVKLNAVTSGVADAKKVIEEAKELLRVYGKRTYLLLDECHRWNKAQSDSVLAAIEQGYIIFIGSTTENPYVSMTRAIVSRCRVFSFSRLKEEDIRAGLKRALSDKERGLGNMNLNVSDEALNHIAWASGGDMRTALNALELACMTTHADESGAIIVGKDEAEQSIQQKSLSVTEDMYYDMISAFIKSMRGSDSSAALYWAERLIEAGCDPMLIARRIMIHACEDVGLADPNAIVVAQSCVSAFERIGLPEGRIPLAEGIIYVSEAPKSNTVVEALELADNAVKTVKHESVPIYLRDPSYKGKDEVVSGYKYPHSYGGWVEQQYLPDELKDAKFYVPSDHGFEKVIRERQSLRVPKKSE